MTDTDRRIAAIATGQLGAFSRAQATDAGLSNRQLRSRVRSGALVQTGPNGFRVAGAPNTLESQLREVLLDIGSPIWVSDATAAALHGFPGFTLRRPFHVAVNADRNVRRNGVVVHRTGMLDPVDREQLDEIPITSPARTLIDIARHATPGQLGLAVEYAFEHQLTSEDHVHRRIGTLRSRGRYGVPTLLGVLERREITRGGESWLERRYLTLLHEARLPRPATQVVLAQRGDHAVRVDCWFEAGNVVVELLGYRFHRTRSQMNRDAARHNALIASGRAVYQFTYDQVTATPTEVVAQTRAALDNPRSVGAEAPA
jgi:very-short-patch-repair endonuclease